jgi:Zn-dependent M16 (insulinase) family peptidase
VVKIENPTPTKSATKFMVCKFCFISEFVFSKLLEIQKIEQFDIVAYKLEHLETGARWLHMDSSDLDNVFAVLFRTPPDDHTGKPHILEHLALCGSRHYPVRDPFYNMLKRSLNTYMNAWTGSDFTMYPFSS